MNDAVLVLVFAGRCVSRREKTRDYEQDEAIKHDTVAQAERWIPGVNKQEP
jgi:hypothetical protein